MNILITGANRGIGLEFTKQYLSDGFNVIACCRNPNKAEHLQQLQKRFPQTLSIELLDVRDPKNIEILADKLKSTSIDILLNNAGIYGPSQIRFGQLEQEDFISVFTVNCIAPILMAQAFIKQIEMSELKTIVNISSQMASIALNTYGDAYYYRASKTALNAVSKSLALDLTNKKIKVLIIDPGWVKTDMGGAGAEITPVESVTKIRQIILNKTLENSGEFISYLGHETPW